MRKLIAFIALMGTVGVVGIHAAAAKTKPPVTLTGKTNTHAQKDLSASSTAKLKLELDDFYFSPTFVKVAPGEQLTITIANEGKAQHTFTSTALDVDKTVAPGKTAKVKVTIPAAGGTIQFHCSFHESMGMQGAFYTGGAGTTATTAGGSAAAAGTVSVGDTRLGKVLVDANGRTLYQIDRDSATSVTCTGACASVWPPLLATGTPTVGAGLDTSKLSMVNGPNGNQIAYAGHPLYLYSNDQAAGDVAGQGVAGVWWVVGADGNKITAT